MTEKEKSQVKIDLNQTVNKHKLLYKQALKEHEKHLRSHWLSGACTVKHARNHSRLRQPIVALHLL